MISSFERSSSSLTWKINPVPWLFWPCHRKHGFRNALVNTAPWASHDQDQSEQPRLPWKVDLLMVRGLANIAFLIQIQDLDLYTRTFFLREGMSCPALTHIFLPLGHWCTCKQSTPIRLQRVFLRPLKLNTFSIVSWKVSLKRVGMVQGFRFTGYENAFQLFHNRSKKDRLESKQY